MPNGLNRFLVETHANASNHADVGGFSIRLHQEIDFYVSRELGLARLFRELGLRLIEDNRAADAAADVEYTPSSVSSRARANARTITRTDAGSSAIA